jgi:hypothetical protein
MIITRVYDHALGPSSHSSYSFAFYVAEYSFLRTTAAHPSYIQEQINAPFNFGEVLAIVHFRKYLGPLFDHMQV